MNTTKEKILNSALSLFAQRGFSSVSVRDIAGELGITQSALYKHYSCKQDIFDQIVKRMEQLDYDHSKDAGVPADVLDTEADSNDYAGTSVADMKQFTIRQFHYWTEDIFASSFRKMLTIEQFRSPEASALYSQYLSSGIIDYITDLFANMKDLNNDVHQKPRDYALRFYGPVFMALNLYDGAKGIDEKAEIIDLVECHVKDFPLEK